MTKRIVILGGGTGGTLSANRMRHLFSKRTSRLSSWIRTMTTSTSQDCFCPLRVDPSRRDRPLSASPAASGHRVPPGPIERVDIDTDTVHLGDGSELTYDVLVVASGSILDEEETEGLTGPGWMQKVFTFYDVAGSRRAARCSRGIRWRSTGGQRSRHAHQVPGRTPRVLLPGDWFSSRPAFAIGSN